MVFNEFYIKIIDFYWKIRIFMNFFKNFGFFFSILDRSPASPGTPGGAQGPRGGSGELFGLPLSEGRSPRQTGEKKLRIRPRGYFVHAAFDFDTPRPWNTAQNSKDKETMTLWKTSFFSNSAHIMIWGYRSAWFFTLIPNPTSKPPQTRLKTRFC